MGDAPEVAPVPAPPRQPAQVEPLTAERSRLHVTVSRRFQAKLSAARDALSHSHPGASEETTLEVGLDLIPMQGQHGAAGGEAGRSTRAGEEVAPALTEM
jgi:hypothetical protein